MTARTRATLWLPGMVLLLVGAIRLPWTAAMSKRGHDENGSSDHERAKLVAVERGLAYARQHRVIRSSSDLSALIVLDYLQRKYALPNDLAFPAPIGDAVGAEKVQLWGRFVGEQRRTDVVALGALTETPSIEELVMHALYCDEVRLPVFYGDLLERFADHGGYELTHASLALKILRDNGCRLQEGRQLTLEDLFRRRMLTLIDGVPQDPQYEELDVRYEALALLQDFLGVTNLPDTQLAKLLAGQQPDGGWRPQADQTSGLHPTILAIWALLARTHPSAPAISFARR